MKRVNVRMRLRGYTGDTRMYVAPLCVEEREAESGLPRDCIHVCLDGTRIVFTERGYSSCVSGVSIKNHERYRRETRSQRE